MAASFAKYGALVALVAQNTIGVIGMRYTRVADGPMYLSSSAVLITECVKLVACLLAVFLESAKTSDFFTILRSKLSAFEILRIGVPSLLYLCQNNLIYYAVTLMDAGLFAVVYQTKLLTTAFFAMCILKKKFSSTQWFALVLLAIGVTLTQYHPSDEVVPADKKADTERLLGVVLTLIAATSSGFAGIYMESILKGSDTSLWMRNVQMGCTSIPLAIGTIFFTKDKDVVVENGLFYGYTTMVLVLILNQAIGGILVAVVMKYADNIIKGFAIAVSLCVTVTLNYFIFFTAPTKYFFGAVILVSVSMFLYLTCGLPPADGPKPAGTVQPLQKRVMRDDTAQTSHAVEDEEEKEQRRPLIEMK